VTALAEAFGSISVIVPAYNAARVVGATLDSVQGYLDAAGVPHEVVVVDDASRDGTPALVASRGRGVRLLVNERNRGKGWTVRRGMLAARMRWALFSDVDNSTTMDHLEGFAPFARDHAVIIASRRLEGSTIVRPQSASRRLLGGAFPRLVRTLALPGISDSQCGFKAFRADVAREVFSRLRTERFAFDVEALLLARLLGARIAEVPARWDNPPDESTVRLRVDTFRMLADVVAMAWRLRALGSLPPPAPDPDVATRALEDSQPDGGSGPRVTSS
jgi:dolichyl-phosphate beta-glucosyltransferase